MNEVSLEYYFLNRDGADFSPVTRAGFGVRSLTVKTESALCEGLMALAAQYGLLVGTSQIVATPAKTLTYYGHDIFKVLLPGVPYRTLGGFLNMAEVTPDREFFFTSQGCHAVPRSCALDYYFLRDGSTEFHFAADQKMAPVALSYAEDDALRAGLLALARRFEMLVVGEDCVATPYGAFMECSQNITARWRRRKSIGLTEFTGARRLSAEQEQRLWSGAA